MIKDPKEELISELGRINSVALNGSMVKANRIGLNEESKDVFSFENTELAPFIGSSVGTYQRQDIQTIITDEFGINPLHLPVDLTAVQTTHDIIDYLNDYTDLKFLKTDLMDYPIQFNDGVPYIAELEFTESSIRFYGKVSIRLIEGDIPIPNVIKEVQTVQFLWPANNQAKGQASLYSYGLDCSSGHIQLIRGGLGLNMGTLAGILKIITNDNWNVLYSPTAFNLNEAQVLYSGVNYKHGYRTNPNYEFVTIVDLSLYCANFAGLLLLHHNDLMSI